MIKQNNTAAFATLYNRYWEKFYALCYWHVLEQETAKDIVQELFIDLWDKRDRIDIRETAEGYLKVAVRNRVLNHIRSLNTKRKHYDAARNNLEKEMMSESLNNERELRRLYQEEIGKLPPRMKEIYMLNKEEGLSITQVAERLDLSEQTIKNQLGNALKKIRSGLEHYRILLFLVFFMAERFLGK